MKWGLDFMGSFNKIAPRKNKFIVVATSCITKWAKELSKYNPKLESWFSYEQKNSKFRCPLEFMADQQIFFLNETMIKLHEMCFIKHKKLTTYYPYCNGHEKNKN